MMLLFSSITFGFGMIAMKRKDVTGLKRWIKVTFVLGLAFICMEVYEFHHLIAEGYGPQETSLNWRPTDKLGGWLRVQYRATPRMKRANF